MADPNLPKQGFSAVSFLMVSKMVLEQNKPITLAYREKPMNPYDSGWRIFHGKETPAYLQDPKNFVPCTAQDLLKKDKTITKILGQPIGSAYNKKRGKKWLRIKNFKFRDERKVTKKIGEDWQLELHNFFEEIDVEGALEYVMAGRSVRIVLWKYDDKTAEETYQYHKENLASLGDNGSLILDTFEESNDEWKKIACQVKEKDGTKQYNVLHTFTIVNNKVLQVSLYFDAIEDKTWAVDTLETVQYIGG
ncbi:MAG: DUF2185 domain-containing protein [Saprospiraceae bacterium]|nr:DUF2185 domain-containing protein [Saprospiraceae bacterium]